MSRPFKPAVTARREPFFGEWQPLVVSMLMLLLGLAAVTTFYASVFAAAHVVAADNGGGREQLGVVTLWACALLFLHGMVPLVRFGFSELPRLVAGGFGGNARNIGVFILLLVVGVVLVFT